MPIEITMPRLSDTMEQGTIVAWNVKEGDEVSAGDVLGDIETDKATMELQNFEDGTVAALLLGEGKTVEVGSVIMVLAEEGEDAAQIRSQYASGAGAAPASTSTSATSAQAGQAVASDTTTSTATAAPPAGEPTDRVIISPLARKIAIERGLDIRSIQGSGPGGRIVRKDVESTDGAPAPSTAAPVQPPAPSVPVTPIPAGPQTAPIELTHPSVLEPARVELSNMRRTIAARLVESKQTIPHYQVTVSVSMDALMDLRKRLNDQLVTQGVKLSVNDFLVRACALAMHSNPHVNSSWGEDGQSIVVHGAVNVGVAIALPAEKGGGLVVATLRGADGMGLRQISTQTREFAGKARDRGLSIEEMSDTTFTISNLGMYGVEHFTAIINPPNSAILAVGGAVRKPVVRGDEIVIGHEMQMTMSSDHRVIDGVMAAEFLSSVRDMLESPATLLV